MSVSERSANGGTPLSRATPAAHGERDAVVQRLSRPIHQFGKLAEIALPTGSGAPGAARMVVAHCLTGLVSRGVLHDAQLLVSEFVTNSVRHGELGAADTVLVRVYLAADSVRLEIVNRGTAGAVLARHPDLRSRGGGFGLDLVDRLTASWGVRRDGGTSVWFEMGRA